MFDRIDKSIEIAAPINDVWQAVTDSTQFGTWFCAEISGPFEAGQTVQARSTYPGYEGVTFELRILKVEFEKRFSFVWPAYVGCTELSCYTHVEFTFLSTTKGTLLRAVESGFDRLPPERRETAFRENEAGWKIQLDSVSNFLTHAV